ncbi:Factor arrest protein 11 [Apophysomyces sp. BC1034]|nr:Factor arrest protein 11 [Apophysomyces sp. BC1034]
MPGRQEQDPLLTPGHLKQAVKNLASKPKHSHENYIFKDTGSLRTEIDEFFNYAEVKIELQDYRREYEREFAGKDVNTESQRDRIQYLFDQFESKTQDNRIRSAKHLVYLALAGTFGEYRDKSDEHMQKLIETNKLLYSCDALTALFHACERGWNEMNFLESAPDRSEKLSIEIDLYLTIFYVVLEVNRHQGVFDGKLGSLDPVYLEFFFKALAKLRERYTVTFPIKKLTLVVWKTILATFGGLGKVKQLKEDARRLHGLGVEDKTSKYTTYTPSEPPFDIYSKLSMKASPELASAMGISAASLQTDLPYYTLFPPKTSQTTKPQIIPTASNTATAFVLPVSTLGGSVPLSINEAGHIYRENMLLSLSNYQIIQEREKAIRRWQRLQLNERNDEVGIHTDRTDASSSQYFTSFETLYTSMVPNLQDIVIVLLKVLLSTVSMNKSSTTDIKDIDCLTSELLNDVDSIRNGEILSKAVSAILTLLLKWSKLSHILKFEYLSQLLVDSGCMLLILKILGAQDITATVAVKTDMENYSFFEYTRTNGTEVMDRSKPAQENGDHPLYTNERNMFWTINLLRVLQMLSKHKPHRIMLLVHYKSSAILKRILKISHPDMELYALKVLKVNMKIISAIYLRCHPILRDDWLSKADTEADIEDGKMEEINLRMLIKMYHGEKYIPSMLPVQDDFSNIENGIYPANRDMGGQHNGISETLEDVELDPDFMHNYQHWLENEVYNSIQQDEDEEDETRGSVHDFPEVGTPVPSSPIASADLLTKEINNLYREELQKEFKMKEAELIIEGGWDAPTLPVTSTGKIVDSKWRGYEDNDDDYDFVDDEDDEEEEEEEDDDPLKNINWQTLSEDELNERLTKVEERTVQRWLSVDINDPQHLKVLNAVEGLDLETECMDEDPPIYDESW